MVAFVGFVKNFWIQFKSTSQGVPYDFSSIMHFRHNAFSLARSKSTVVPRNRIIPKTKLGSSATATDLDFLHVNLLYCGGTDAKLIYCCHLVVISCNLNGIPHALIIVVIGFKKDIAKTKTV